MNLGWLYAWWKWPRPKLDHLHFVLITRRGCHLCDEAWQLLKESQRRHGFTLTSVDVDGDPELVSKYGTCVPVVTVNGKVRFRGRVNAVLLKRLLRAESDSTNQPRA